MTASGRDVWRLGVLDQEELRHMGSLAAALPPEARAIALGEQTGDTMEVVLPGAAEVLRGFLTSALDALPRLCAPADSDALPYLGWDADRVPGLQTWTASLAPATVALSLRIDPVPTTGTVDLVDSAFDATVQVHGVDRPAVVCDAVDLGRHPRMAESAFAADPRIAVLEALRRAALQWAPLEELTRSAAPNRIRLEDDDVTALAGAGRRLRSEGIEIHWPRELMAHTSTLMILGDSTASGGHTTFGGDRAFEFDWRVAIGDEVLTRDDMEKLVASERAVVRLRNRYVVADSALVRKTLQRRTGAMPLVDALRASLTGRPAGARKRPVSMSAGRSPGLRGNSPTGSPSTCRCLPRCAHSYGTISSSTSGGSTPISRRTDARWSSPTSPRWGASYSSIWTPAASSASSSMAALRLPGGKSW
ncbi:SNF2 helicase-associated domain-containing protein [Rhodococcus tibetensis]|uniref:SNF2 helicase-associated domain-containing protein n=1 Tax=Rhodococcus tibetensis TaxID=2965064 RepID=A0ABT1QKL9_9NOCA|nr:SNF2 helicase-associated domain-containing protein [Rhodococcus sp. FXJ9.536]MCQ4122799.1 SNF2 helicase-associated domain-containing protein [Rhodococcus sp. FXJ9.536]